MIETEHDYRCRQCHKLLAKGDIRDGYVNIKCPKCDVITEFRWSDKIRLMT